MIFDTVKGGNLLFRLTGDAFPNEKQFLTNANRATLTMIIKYSQTIKTRKIKLIATINNKESKGKNKRKVDRVE